MILINTKKWLELDQKFLSLDEPTFGVDVAAKFQVRKIIKDLSKRGPSIILITNEYPELKNLCDKMLIMFKE